MRAARTSLVHSRRRKYFAAAPQISPHRRIYFLFHALYASLSFTSPFQLAYGSFYFFTHAFARAELAWPLQRHDDFNSVMARRPQV